MPAFCCFIDSNGEVVDYRRLTNLLKRRLSPMEREREEKVHVHVNEGERCGIVTYMYKCIYWKCTCNPGWLLVFYKFSKYS